MRTTNSHIQFGWLTPGLLCLAVVAGCDRSDHHLTDPSTIGPDPSKATQSPLDGDGAADVTDPLTKPTLASDPSDRSNAIAESERLVERGKPKAALERLRKLLLANPNDVEVIFRLANLTASQGEVNQAIEMLGTIPIDHPEAGFPALGQSADWLMALRRYDEAEDRYRKILKLHPESPIAHRKLAFLLNCQGRRHEAAEHIRHLCRQGNVRQDELHALMNLSHAMVDANTPAPRSASESPTYFPIGVVSQARILFGEERYQEAVELLQESIAAGTQPPSVVAFYGRTVAEAQDAERLQSWLDQVDPSSTMFSEHWAALGLWLVSANRYPEAARALLEAIDRDPTDFRSISRLRSVMETLGQEEVASRWDDRAILLQRLFKQNNQVADSATPELQIVLQLADTMDQLDRKLEALLWRSIAGFHRGISQDAMNEFQQSMQKIVASGEGFPNQASRLCAVNPQQFPLPRLDWQSQPQVSSMPSPELDRQIDEVAASFSNVARAVGIDHVYHVASSPVERGFSVYQSIGGAVAVLDFDIDGLPDLYFAQGGADPPAFIGTMSNQLYRQVDGSAHDVTLLARVSESRYSTGLTAGDWNQDGFPDIIVGNIGTNTWFINNGDGTFTKHAFDDRDDKTLMTTSLAIADLDRDSLPDLFELNYLHDQRITDHPETNAEGEVIEPLMPQQFRPGMDRIGTNDGSGVPRLTNVSDQNTAARAGLGLVVGDFDHHPGNEIFVGNDVYANQLWTLDPTNTWRDVAMLRGCAYGFSGAKTASMGIASGDFDRNGWLDFHVTNFQKESASYYVNNDGQFQDRNVQYGLSEASRTVLGFGTQAIDYDNDSDLDLLVTNGHIEDAIGNHSIFQQPPQLFQNVNGRFQTSTVNDPSGYWDQNHLGRGLATLDWNGDGRMDWVVTHLNEPSALMVNQSPSDNHWIQVELKGVKNERDAIGARVKLTVAGKELTEWQTAGDGFFSRNEPLISFGLGRHTMIERLRVIWPDGGITSIDAPPIDCRLLIVEGQSQAFPY
ncbi:FG-GAP-like repeat-containing protein [Roseiconus lacunae]|uniref:FG-GAP-like repeat-containing protein n=1 Tax=Roseiconus lacunae TaxID=2605694 RepID=UPI0030881383|nr:FG-GAP-like repeat-containing protein [Stieleria sp. HD01]